MSRELKARRVTDALKKLVKESPGCSLNELRVVVALERAIARFENHPRLSSHLIFKGGFVLLKTLDTLRFTRDVDALALGISRSRVPEMVDRALKLDLDDGLWFGDLSAKDLTDQGPYGGYRFDCAFQIGDPPKGGIEKIRKLSRIHIDVGFGDAIEKMPKKQPMVSIISEGKPVSWSVYPLEYIFAEKLEALFSRGSGSSRSKDVYDMVLLFPKCNNKADLMDAIIRTFANRKTPIPQSFEHVARAFDTSIMHAAWSSVELPIDSMSFENTWHQLLNCFSVIDSG